MSESDNIILNTLKKKYFELLQKELDIFKKNPKAKINPKMTAEIEALEIDIKKILNIGEENRVGAPAKKTRKKNVKPDTLESDEVANAS
jgi:hypothetical protein